MRGERFLIGAILTLLLALLVAAPPQHTFTLIDAPLTELPAVIQLTYSDAVLIIGGTLFDQEGGATVQTYAAADFIPTDGSNTIFRLSIDGILPGTYHLLVEKSESTPPNTPLVSDLIEFDYINVDSGLNLHLVDAPNVNLLRRGVDVMAAFYQAIPYDVHFTSTEAAWCKYSEFGQTDPGFMAPFHQTGSPGAPATAHVIEQKNWPGESIITWCNSTADGYMLKSFIIGYEDEDPAYSIALNPPVIVDPLNRATNITFTSSLDQELYCELLLENGEIRTTGQQLGLGKEDFDAYVLNPWVAVTPPGVTSQDVIDFVATCYNRAGRSTAQPGSIAINYTFEPQIVVVNPPQGFSNVQNPLIQLHVMKAGSVVQSSCAFTDGSTPQLNSPDGGFTWESQQLGLGEGTYTHDVECILAGAETVTGNITYAIDFSFPNPANHHLDVPGVICEEGILLTGTATPRPNIIIDQNFAGYNYTITYDQANSITLASGVSSGNIATGISTTFGSTYRWDVRPYDLAGNIGQPILPYPTTQIIPPGDDSCDLDPPTASHRLTTDQETREIYIDVYCDDGNGTGCEESYRYTILSGNEVCDFSDTTTWPTYGISNPATGAPPNPAGPFTNSTLCYEVRDRNPIAPNVDQRFATVNVDTSLLDVLLVEPNRLLASGAALESGFDNSTPFTITFETTHRAECRYTVGSGQFVEPFETNRPFELAGGTTENPALLHSTQFTANLPSADNTYYVRCRNENGSVDKEFTLGYEERPPTLAVSFSRNPIVDPLDTTTTAFVEDDNSPRQRIFCEARWEQNLANSGAGLTPPLGRQDAGAYQQSAPIDLFFGVTSGVKEIAFDCWNRAGAHAQVRENITLNLTAAEGLVVLNPGAFTNEQPVNFAVQVHREGSPLQLGNCWFTDTLGGTNIGNLGRVDSQTYAENLFLGEGAETRHVTCLIFNGEEVHGSHTFTVDRTMPPVPDVLVPPFVCGDEELAGTASMPGQPEPNFDRYEYEVRYQGWTVPLYNGSSSNGELTTDISAEEGEIYEWRVDAVDKAGNRAGAPLFFTEGKAPNSTECDTEPPTASHSITNDPILGLRFTVECTDNDACLPSFSYSWLPEGAAQVCDYGALPSLGTIGQSLPVPGNGTYCYEVSDRGGNTAQGAALVNQDTPGATELTIGIEQPNRLLASNGAYESGFATAAPYDVIFRTTEPAECRWTKPSLPTLFGQFDFLNPFPEGTLAERHTISGISDAETTVLVACQNSENPTPLEQTFEIGFESGSPSFTATFDPPIVVRTTNPSTTLSISSINSPRQKLYCEATVDGITVTSGMVHAPPLFRSDAGAYDYETELTLNFGNGIGVIEKDVEITCWNRAGTAFSRTEQLTLDFSSEGALVLVSPAAYTNQQPVRVAVRVERNQVPVEIGSCWFTDSGAPEYLDPLTPARRTYFQDINLPEGAQSKEVTCQIFGGDQISSTLSFIVDRTIPSNYEITAPSQLCGAENQLSAELSLPDIWTTDENFAGYEYSIMYAQGGNVVLDSGTIAPADPRQQTLVANFAVQEDRQYLWQVWPYDLAENKGAPLLATTTVRASDDASCDDIPPTLDLEITEEEGLTSVVVTCDDENSGCTTSFAYDKLGADADESDCTYSSFAVYGSTLTFYEDGSLCYQGEDVRTNVARGFTSITVQAAETGGACSVDADCATNYCSNGICTEASCSDGLQNGFESGIDCGGPCTGCSDGNSCTQDEDCATNECTNGICTSSSCFDGVENGLETDVDCGGPICDTCGESAQCSGDSDCAAGYECVSGTCEEVTIPPPSCTTRDQCIGNEVCINGECAPPNTQQPAHCIDDSMCTPDLICILGNCEPLFIPAPVPTACFDNFDCAPDEACIDGECGFQLAPDGRPSCSTDAECNPDEKCHEGECHAILPPGSGVACDIYTPCPPGESCFSNECRAIETDRCSEVICGFGEVCENGFCKTEESAGGSGCSFNDECPYGEVCSDGACVVPTKERNIWGLIMMLLGLFLMGGSGYWLYMLHQQHVDTTPAQMRPTPGASYSRPAQQLSPEQRLALQRQRQEQVAAIKKRRVIASERMKGRAKDRSSIMSAFEEKSSGKRAKSPAKAQPAKSGPKTAQKSTPQSQAAKSPQKRSTPKGASQTRAAPKTKKKTKSTDTAFAELDKLIDEHEKKPKK